MSPRSRISKIWLVVWWAVRHPAQWFWPVWAVVTIFVSGLGFWRAEHAVDAVDEEIKDRSAAIIDAAKERQEQICENAKENVEATQAKDEALLTGLIVDLINAGDDTPEEKQRNIDLVKAIVHARVSAEYDKLPDPAVCVAFMQAASPQESVVTVVVPE